jgi:hypothetical protein
MKRRLKIQHMQKTYVVHAQWDSQAHVWVATSEDVVGLATEAQTIEALTQKLEVMVPELLQLNSEVVACEIAFELLTRKLSVISLPRAA